MAAFFVRGALFRTVRAATLHELAGRLNEVAAEVQPLGTALEVVQIVTHTREVAGDYTARETEPRFFEAIFIVGMPAMPPSNVI